ncbi:NADH-ubiquinone oxidoreductase chain 4 [Phtheirospermum japonicum]|uniref:NADH-ubiquinone oxidoreductase chain 4 n=1 Tax=Phtheirospermum japonicum TaxID=374723 RepID=A0A830D7N9_9LAMI|nr:NADH-ubiquinone oxidoreductase chain 4 [Phtheirospermum japonicum]
MDCFFRLFHRQSAYGTSSYLVTQSSCRGTYSRIRHLGRNSFKIGNLRVFKILNTHVSQSDTLFHSFHLYSKRN